MKHTRKSHPFWSCPRSKCFSSLRVPAALLLSQLPLLEPRYYSLCSSPSTHPGRAHLTVGLVHISEGVNGFGAERFGLCSGWFESLKQDDKVSAFFHSNDHFHFPDDLSEPVILIGIGTGIAPFMSFFRQRKFQVENTGRNEKTTWWFLRQLE